jgi:hypothetical protein
MQCSCKRPSNETLGQQLRCGQPHIGHRARRTRISCRHSRQQSAHPAASAVWPRSRHCASLAAPARISAARPPGCAQSRIVGARRTSAACTPCLTRGTGRLQQQSRARQQLHVAPARARCRRCRPRTPRWPRAVRAAAHCASACRCPQTPQTPPAGLRSSARTSHGGRGPGRCPATKTVLLGSVQRMWRDAWVRNQSHALAAHLHQLAPQRLQGSLCHAAGRSWVFPAPQSLSSGTQSGWAAARRPPPEPAARGRRCTPPRQAPRPCHARTRVQIRAEANQTTWDCCTPWPALEHKLPVGQDLRCSERHRRSVSSQAGQ